MFSPMILELPIARESAQNRGITRPWPLRNRWPPRSSVGVLLVAGFEVQDYCPAHGQGQLHGFTHDAASDEKLCAEMVALS